MIIPLHFFEEKKQRIPIKIPFSIKNEEVVKHFLDKLNAFTQDNYEFVVIWGTFTCIFVTYLDFQIIPFLQPEDALLNENIS